MHALETRRLAADNSILKYSKEAPGQGILYTCHGQMQKHKRTLPFQDRQERNH